MEIQLWNYSEEEVAILSKLPYVTFDCMCPILPIYRPIYSTITETSAYNLWNCLMIDSARGKRLGLSRKQCNA